MIDISMTATLRSDVHSEIIRSLEENLITKEKIRLVLNIDLKGDKENFTQDSVLEQFEKSSLFFDIIYNKPKKPYFFDALKWVGSNASADHVLQGEDDWVLRRPICIDDLILIMDNHNFDAFGLFCKKKAASGRTRYTETINGTDYTYIELKRTAHPFFTPSLLKQSYLKPITSLMEKTNKKGTRPVQFIRTREAQNLLKSMKKAKYLCVDFDKNRNRSLLCDIGRKGKKGKQIDIK